MTAKYRATTVLTKLLKLYSPVRLLVNYYDMNNFPLQNIIGYFIN